MHILKSRRAMGGEAMAQRAQGSAHNTLRSGSGRSGARLELVNEFAITTQIYCCIAISDNSLSQNGYGQKIRRYRKNGWEGLGDHHEYNSGLCVLVIAWVIGTFSIVLRALRAIT